MTGTRTPDSLNIGDLVGPWRIEGYAGRGSYGAVFRARRADDPGSPPVALKMAVFPHDPRFEREVELLRRTRHPAVPRLIDQGWWEAEPGVRHPYVVMEWIRGQRLYEWARMHTPTSREVLRVVAQLAWGLEVLHRGECLHRDLKGDNILVEPEGRAVLTDFGSGTWKGAPPLTHRVLPPNTPEYRSPEALRFEWQHWSTPGARYHATPADDLYALGVTLYRLLTRIYPPPGTEPEDLKKQIQGGVARRQCTHELNPRVVPELSALVERLLAAEPEARGTASELAQAAETSAEHLGSAADVPLWASVKPAVQTQAGPARPVDAKTAPAKATEHKAGTLQARQQVRPVPWRNLLALLTMSLAVVGPCWMAPEWSAKPSETARAEALDAGMEPDAGTRGLGDDALTTRMEVQSIPSEARSISLDMPKQPLPGQRRPPCKRDWEKIIHGGCWVRVADKRPPCSDDTYQWQEECYDPAWERARPPTTQNPQAQ
ncbi:serine/threonine-protein kinase [Hyalangium minutum]|uniref:non-specific serine/threonine protein kinase n=1 Tax=Hyalangium minutum TaxID=394096 RepID=A0A085WQT8_9BACT|nr:serine/threonine-protein kinase [Hyalangium minutum]KFE70051.1 hypothetical protein DB31_5093 [Hyalangium minutum]